MSSTGTSVKNRRLKNFFLYPRIQIKYAVIYSGLTALLGLLLVIMQLKTNADILKYVENPDAHEAISTLQNKNLIVQAFIYVISSALLFLITITMTHRFLGPIVAIIRHFETLRTQGHAKPLALRREDELAPLISYFQSVDIKVSAKQES